MDEASILMLFFTGSSLLIVVLSIPMILRRVKPNSIYGFRTGKTLSDEQIWYDANAYAGKLLLVWGTICAIASVVLYFVFESDLNAYTITLGMLDIGGLVLVLVLSFLYLRSL